MMVNSRAIKGVNDIICEGKEQGLSKEKVIIQLARYRDTAQYQLGVHKSDYVSYVCKLLENY